MILKTENVRFSPVASFPRSHHVCGGFPHVMCTVCSHENWTVMCQNQVEILVSLLKINVLNLPFVKFLGHCTMTSNNIEKCVCAV